MTMSPYDLEIRFEDIFQRLLARDPIDSYEIELSSLFEFIATRLLGDCPSRSGHYFDGVVRLSATVKASRQVEFQGEMWVGANRDQWTEPFEATVTDKRITKQGIWIVVQVGTDRSEGKLKTVCSITEQAKPCAPPNEDSLRSLGNSGVSEGPRSMS
jgi:hypothetical protein